MTMIAYAFLQHRRLATARREKKNQWAAASTDLASYSSLGGEGSHDWSEAHACIQPTRRA